MTMATVHSGKGLIGYAIVMAVLIGQPAAASSTPLLTYSEQAALVSSMESMPLSNAEANEKALRRIDQTIFTAQHGEPYYRRPVSAAQVKTLQQRLTVITGQRWSYPQTAATVDYFQAHRRESRGMGQDAFLAKLKQSSGVSRPSHHGNVAEFAEARARGMLLTKDIRSQTFDLTEERTGPRSAQLKVYQNGIQGLRSLQSDVSHLPIGSRSGILPRAEIDQLLSQGKLTAQTSSSGQRVYLPTLGPTLRISAMRSLESAAASQQYNQLGQASVTRLYNTRTAGRGPSPELFRAAGNRILSVGAIAFDGTSSIYSLYLYRAGRISRLEMLQRASDSALGLSFWGTGAVIGSFIPGVGTAMGAAAGSLVALPVRFIMSAYWTSQANEMAERETRVLNEALARKYGLAK